MMTLTSKKKRLLLTAILTVLLTVLLAPVYSDNNMFASILESTHQNKIARIDIFNAGNRDNKIEILPPSPHLNVQYPEWCRYPNGQCSMLEAKISRDWRTYTLQFKVIHDGLITIGLRGPDKASGQARFPVIVDYKDMRINDQPLLSSTQKTWHDAPYNYSFPAQDGDVITLSFQTRKHHFRFSDFLTFYHLNGHLLFCVVIISFFIFYKVVQYISRFKIIERNSRIDIIFLCFFFLLLFMPMMRINDDDWLAAENRKAHPYVPLFTNHQFNQAYGAQVENWFNDHFFGRTQLVRLNAVIQKLNRVISNKAAVFDTQTNWLFNYSQINQHIFPDYNQALLESLEQFHSFLSENGITFYLFIVPSKTDLYADFVPGYKKIPKIQNEAQIRFLEKNASFPVIFPIESLRQAAQKDYVYFKTEHHWTEWGAFIGYQTLMERIRKDFPGVHEVKETDYVTFYDKRVRGDWERHFTLGQTFQMMNLPYDPQKLLDTEYKYYTPIREITPTITDIPYYKIKSFQNPDPNASAIKVFLAGTSMNENLLQFLPYSFRQLTYYRLNNVQNVSYQDGFKIASKYKNDILKMDPDIFILSINSENIPELLNLMRD